MTDHAHAAHLEDITAHIERHFGAVESVFHEILPDRLHIDVLMVQPTAARPWITLVTSGMSDLPLDVPAGTPWPKHTELVICVPVDAKLDQESLQDEANYWPIRCLKLFARMPHEQGSWLGPGHTSASDPPEPLAPGVPFQGLGLVELLDVAARRLRAKDGTEIGFLQIVPLYREELEWKLAEKRDGVLDELFDSPMLRVASSQRPNLKGSAFLAKVDAMSAAIVRGRRVVTVIAVVLVALAIADAVACHADGVRLPWARLGVAVGLASWLPGSAFARWIVIALALAGVGFGGWLVATSGLDSWREIVLAASVPVLIAVAAVLALVPAVRVWYGSQRYRTKS